VIALLSTSKNLQAQSTETKPQSISQMRETAKALADCQLLIREAEFLRQDTAALKKENARKENVIVQLQAQRNTLKGAFDTSQQAISKRDEIITGQQHVIEKTSKVKPWAVGITGGVGVAGLQPTYFVGIGFMRTLIRF
jgi:hypothetical protein